MDFFLIVEVKFLQNQKFFANLLNANQNGLFTVFSNEDN